MTSALIFFENSFESAVKQFTKLFYLDLGYLSGSGHCQVILKSDLKAGYGLLRAESGYTNWWPKQVYFKNS